MTDTDHLVLAWRGGRRLGRDLHAAGGAADAVARGVWMPVIQPDGPPVLMQHSSCGQISTAIMTCSACGEPMDARDLQAVAGPEDLDGLAIAGGPP
jgi:hypothetical protein